MALFFFSLGCYAAIAQVALFRELAVLFLGHEVSFAVALAAWLLWGGVGSLRARHAAHPTRALTWTVVGLVLTPPLTMCLIRSAKLTIPFGFLPGVATELLYPFLLLAVPCLLFGAAFTLSVANAGGRGARVYFLESAGALAGGLVSTFGWVGRWPGLEVVALSAVGLGVLYSWVKAGQFHVGPPAATGVAFVFLAAVSPLEKITRAIEFRGYVLEAQTESRYDHLALGRFQDTSVLFQNGVVTAQRPDAAAREERVHWALLAHPHPSQVLAVGVPAALASGEIFKHPVTRIDWVEPDTVLVGWLRPWVGLAPPGRMFREIPADPREWIRSNLAQYDVIVQSLPEPVNAALNRYFTREFFEEARRALARGGILVFTLPSSENYLPPEIAAANASILGALRQAFPFIEMLPGETLTVLASAAPLDLEARTLASRYQSRRLRTATLRPETLPYFLNPERRAALTVRLAQWSNVRPNTDARPVSYALAWRVWLAKFLSPLHYAGLLLGVGLAGWLIHKNWRLHRNVLLHSREGRWLGAMGFSGMVMEVVLLMRFQAVSGALYWQMGLFLAAFMAGLAAGSGVMAWGTPRPGGDPSSAPRLLHPIPSVQRNLRRGYWTFLCMKIRRKLCGLSMGLPRPIAFHWGNGVNRWMWGFALGMMLLGTGLTWGVPGRLVMLPFSPLVFFCGALGIAGFLVGGAFPLALRAGHHAGVLYAADLWGSALGALLGGAFLVPLWGDPATLGLAAILPLLSLIPRKRQS